MGKLKIIITGIIIFIISYINKDIDVLCMEGQNSTTNIDTDADAELEKKPKYKKPISYDGKSAITGGWMYQTLYNSVYSHRPSVTPNLSQTSDNELTLSEEEKLCTEIERELPSPPTHITNKSLTNNNNNIEINAKAEILAKIQSHIENAKNALNTSSINNNNMESQESINTINYYKNKEKLELDKTITQNELIKIKDAALAIENYAQNIQDISKNSFIPTLEECSNTYEKVSQDMKTNSIKLYNSWKKHVFYSKIFGGALLLGGTFAYIYKSGNLLPMLTGVKDFGKFIFGIFKKKAKDEGVKAVTNIIPPTNIYNHIGPAAIGVIIANSARKGLQLFKKMK